MEIERRRGASSTSSFLPWLVVSRLGSSVAQMVYAGSLPFLLAPWDMSAAEAGAVQATFNICYAISLFICSWAADHFGARRIFLGANICSALAFGACALWASTFETALPLFALLALALGGAYTPAIMLVAEHVDPRRRGVGVGWILAGSSTGYFLAIALCTALVPIIGYQALWLWLCPFQILAVIAAWRAIALLNDNRSPPEDGGSLLAFWQAMRTRNSVLLTSGYTAHCWELLGAWAWVPAFLALSMSGGSGDVGLLAAIGIAASLHLSGALATIVAGIGSDRWGNKVVLVTMAAAGAFLSLSIGWISSSDLGFLLLIASFYGFAVLGDSGVLSAAMTEAVPARFLGSMLAFRSILGFGAGALSPLAFGWVLDLTNMPGVPPENWGWAFCVLGAGGVMATICASMLRPNRHLAGGGVA